MIAANEAERVCHKRTEIPANCNRTHRSVLGPQDTSRDARERIITVFVDEKAIFCKMLFTFHKRTGQVALSGIRIEDCNCVNREDCANELCKLGAGRLVEIDEQRAATEFVQLLQRIPLQARFSRTALLTRGHPAHDQRAKFKSAECNPILRIGNIERKSRSVEEVIQTSRGQKGYDCSLPESTENGFYHHDQKKEEAKRRRIEVQNPP